MAPHFNTMICNENTSKSITYNVLQAKTAMKFFLFDRHLQSPLYPDSELSTDDRGYEIPCHLLQMQYLERRAASGAWPKSKCPPTGAGTGRKVAETGAECYKM